MTFGGAPRLHLHAPHDDGLQEYQPHEQDFLLKITHYFEEREDFQNGIPIPDKFREGEYLEGIGQEIRVCLRLPLVEKLLAHTSRTWPGTIFSIFSDSEYPEARPGIAMLPEASHYLYHLCPSFITSSNVKHYHHISVTPTTETDELISTDEDWIYPPTPPRLPSLKLPVIQQFTGLQATDTKPTMTINTFVNITENSNIVATISLKALEPMDDTPESPPALEYIDSKDSMATESNTTILSTGPQNEPMLSLETTNDTAPSSNSSSGPPSLRTMSPTNVMPAPDSNSQRPNMPFENLPNTLEEMHEDPQAQALCNEEEITHVR